MNPATEDTLTTSQAIPASPRPAKHAFFDGIQHCRHSQGDAKYARAHTRKAVAVLEESIKETSKSPKNAPHSPPAAKDTDTKKVTKKRKWKKPKDMPKRPLSAYNLFFASERKRMIHNGQLSAVSDGEVERTSHGKMGFAGLARTVASKWKALDAEARLPLEIEAEKEQKRYKRELEQWKLNQDRQQMEGQGQSYPRLQPNLTQSPPRHPTTQRRFSCPTRSMSDSHAQTFFPEKEAFNLKPRVSRTGLLFDMTASQLHLSSGGVPVPGDIFSSALTCTENQHQITSDPTSAWSFDVLPIIPPLSPDQHGTPFRLNSPLSASMRNLVSKLDDEDVSFIASLKNQE